LRLSVEVAGLGKEGAWSKKMKKKSKPADTPKKEQGSQALRKAVSQYKEYRAAIAKKLFREYDLKLVAMVAEQFRNKGMTPTVAASEALKVLDAYQDALAVRKQKFDAMVNAEVPEDALKLSFRDGVRTITSQQNRPGRGEEHFGKFLRFTMGREGGAKELERLKRDGFTRVETGEFETKYEEFRLRRRKKL
jgi:hypothetical protein